MHKHCFLPLLLVSVLKFYVSNCIALCLVTHIVVHFLHLSQGFLTFLGSRTTWAPCIVNVQHIS